MRRVIIALIVFAFGFSGYFGYKKFVEIKVEALLEQASGKFNSAEFEEVFYIYKKPLR
jgi:hypothetical protein